MQSNFEAPPLALILTNLTNLASLYFGSLYFGSFFPGNTFQMLEYLNPTFLRMFIQPLATFRWRDFISNRNRADWYPTQFGLSFNGDVIINEGGYSAAVYGLRNGPAVNKRQSFWEWLISHPEVDWKLFLSKLSTTEPGVAGMNLYIE